MIGKLLEVVFDAGWSRGGVRLLLRRGVLCCIGLMACSHAASAQGHTDSLVIQGRPGAVVLDCDRPGSDRCIFFAPENAQIKRFSVTDLKSGGGGDGRFVRFGDGSIQGSHREVVLVLLDTTRGIGDGRVSTLTATREAAKDIVARLRPDADVAVGVFGSKFSMISGFGATPAQSDKAISDIEFDEVNTRLYEAVGQSIEVLSEQRATVRRLIILSDGLAEDDRSIHEANIVASAVDSQVQISALGLFWHPRGAQEIAQGIDVLTGLTRPTNGIFAQEEILNRRINGSGFLARLQDQRDNSGYVVFDQRPNAVAVEISVEVPSPGYDDQPKTRYYHAELNGAGYAKAANHSESETVTTAEPDSTFDVLPFSISWPQLPLWLVILLSLAAVLSLGVFLWWVLGRRRGTSEISILPDEQKISPSSASGATAEFGGNNSETRQIAGGQSVQQITARLNVVNGTAPPYEIRSSRVSIGRGNDNDLILPHDSISRVHCELHRTRDGSFSITDLDSLNHVQVNGVKVRSGRLQNGDTVRLGEVELHFEYAR